MPGMPMRHSFSSMPAPPTRVRRPGVTAPAGRPSAARPRARRGALDAAPHRRLARRPAARPVDDDAVQAGAGRRLPDELGAHVARVEALQAPVDAVTGPVGIEVGDAVGAGPRARGDRGPVRRGERGHRRQALGGQGSRPPAGAAPRAAGRPRRYLRQRPGTAQSRPMSSAFSKRRRPVTTCPRRPRPRPRPLPPRPAARRAAWRSPSAPTLESRCRRSTPSGQAPVQQARPAPAGSGRRPRRSCAAPRRGRPESDRGSGSAPAPRWRGAR